MSRGNQETRKRKRKERKKRKALQRRSLKTLEESTSVVNEWRSCTECNSSFWARKRVETRCNPCRKKARSFEARKRQALRKYEERKAAENLDRELLRTSPL